MLSYILRRVLLAIPTVFGVVTLTFVVMRILPTDLPRLIAGIDATPAQVEQIRESLHLDRPVFQQYVDYVAHLARGDLGQSVRGRTGVGVLIRERLPNTLLLAGLAVGLSVLIGVPLGIVAAVTKGGVLDSAVQVTVALAMSAPGFWVALMLVFIFAEQLSWFPAVSHRTPRGLVLPVLTLALPALAILARMTRATLLEVLHEDYVRTARAKGLRGRRVIIGHGLGNALIPIITIVGLQAGFLLGGSVIVETIFSYPGVGLLVVDAINRRDFPVVQGVVVVIATLFVLINLTVDVSYAFIDPRIRLR